MRRKDHSWTAARRTDGGVPSLVLLLFALQQHVLFVLFFQEFVDG